MATATVESPKENPVHYPPDRCFRVWVGPAFLLLFVALAVLPLVAAWAQFLTVGLPPVPTSPRILPEAVAAPSGFPAWLRVTHYVNFLFLILLARSGLRVENQLGYKMVKWIKAVEFVGSEEHVGKGHGGKNEDDEYFDLEPDI